MRVDEMLATQIRENRRLQEPDQVQLECHEEPDADSDHEGTKRVNDAPAQFLEVIEERHLTRRRLGDGHGFRYYTTMARKSRDIRRLLRGPQQVARQARLIASRILFHDAI